MATDKPAKEYIFFVLKFLGAFFLFSWLFGLSMVNNALIWLFLQISRGFIFLIGQGIVAVVDNTFMVNSISMIVEKECTGAAMYALFIAFAFAYGITKKSWKHLVFGLLMLIGLNTLRLFTIILSTFFGPQAFAIIHDFLWPSTFFIFTLMVVLYYIKRRQK